MAAGDAELELEFAFGGWLLGTEVIPDAAFEYVRDVGPEMLWRVIRPLVVDYLEREMVARDKVLAMFLRCDDQRMRQENEHEMEDDGGGGRIGA